MTLLNRLTSNHCSCWYLYLCV